MLQGSGPYTQLGKRARRWLCALPRAPPWDGPTILRRSAGARANHPQLVSGKPAQYARLVQFLQHPNCSVHRACSKSTTTTRAARGLHPASAPKRPTPGEMVPSSPA